MESDTGGHENSLMAPPGYGDEGMKKKRERARSIARKPPMMQVVVGIWLEIWAN
jgi:hypothetical protein